MTRPPMNPLNITDSTGATPIPNATEVASEKVEVPPDPGCHLVRAFYVGANRWHTFDSTHRTAEEAIGSAWAARSTGKYLATRIIRIPPQGEAPSVAPTVDDSTAQIVKWLRDQERLDGWMARMFADRIEAGDHMKGGA